MDPDWRCISMYFLLKMVIFQPAMLVYQRVLDPLVSLVVNQKSTRARFGTGGLVLGSRGSLAWNVMPSGSILTTRTRWWFQPQAVVKSPMCFNREFGSCISCHISDRLQGQMQPFFKMAGFCLIQFGACQKPGFTVGKLFMFMKGSLWAFIIHWFSSVLAGPHQNNDDRATKNN